MIILPLEKMSSYLIWIRVHMIIFLI